MVQLERSKDSFDGEALVSDMNIKVLGQRPNIKEVEQGIAGGVCLEAVSFENIFCTQELVQESIGELDPEKVNYLARSIKKGEFRIPRILTKAWVVRKENELPEFQYEVLHKPGLVRALGMCGQKDCEAIVLYGLDDFNLKTAHHKDLIRLCELGTKIDMEAFVPVDRLILEGMINDEQKEERLTKEMGDRGQEIRIWVRARLDQNEVVYDVVDGLHRSSSLSKLKIMVASAKVSYGMSDEELYDQRVAAATTQSVKFARVISDMQKSYQESVWAKQYHLRLSQIIGLATNKDKFDQPGKILGLTSNESKSAIAWAERKATVWREDISTIYLQIRAAENSFEEITKHVRSSQGGGHKGSGVFNAVKFFALVDELPHDLHLQRKMLAIIKEHNLNSNETRSVARVLKLKHRIPSVVKALMLDPVNVAGEVLEEEGLEINDDSVIRKVKTAGQMSQRDGSEKRSHRNFRLYNGDTWEASSQINPSVLTDVNFQHMMAELPKDRQTLNWLERVPNISQEEIIVVMKLFCEGKFPEAVCQELRITSNKLEQLVFSAQRKYALYVEDLHFAQQFVKTN